MKNPDPRFGLDKIYIAGVAATPIRFREATLIGADGVVSSAKRGRSGLQLRLRPVGLALRATPSAPLTKEDIRDQLRRSELWRESGHYSLSTIFVRSRSATGRIVTACPI